MKHVLVLWTFFFSMLIGYATAGLGVWLPICKAIKGYLGW